MTLLGIVVNALLSFVSNLLTNGKAETVTVSDTGVSEIPKSTIDEVLVRFEGL